jgi:hypothetical protein
VTMRSRCVWVGSVLWASCALALGSACARSGSAAPGVGGSPVPPDESRGGSGGSAAPGSSLGAHASGARTAHAPPTYAYAASVENTEAGCQVPPLPEPLGLPRLEKLPDPFEKLDGTRISKRTQWRCRRQEILQQAEKYIYGQKPPKPEKVSGTVTQEAISVAVEHAGKRIHFAADIVLPRGRPPFAALINLGKKGAFGGTRLGESFILEQGVAIIYYDHNELGKEGKPEASRGLPNPGLFYDLYGGRHSAGLLMAWAWGASRLMDVLQAAGGDVIDSSRIAVTGCSRNGKGAFTVGAFDERIALTIPQETSTAGIPAYRIVDVLNGAERTNYNFYGLNWLSNDFKPFVENAAQLPIDSHEVVALVAPRGLLVLDNPHIAQFAAPAAHAAVLAGAEVYTALGAAGNISYVSDVVDEKHCASGKPEYTEPLRHSIAKFLKHQGGAPGVIRASPQGSADLAQWRSWQTPTLEDDLAH